MHWFFQTKAPRFEQLPFGLGVGLLPKGNGLVAGMNGGPDIVAAPLQADEPGLVQQFDLAVRVDVAHEMQATRGKRQPALGDNLTQGTGQQSRAGPSANLRWGLTLQGRGIIVIHIPVPEQRRFGDYLGAVGELLPRPTSSGPDAVKRFDLVIAFGIVVGREQGFDATPQTQPHDLTEHARMGMPAAERAFVVELMDEWQPQMGPSLPQMGAGGRAGFVAVLRQPDRITGVVDGVKILDGFATVNMFGDNVGGLNRIHLPGHRPGIIGGERTGSHGVGQLMAGQNALNGRFARQRAHAQLFQMSPNRARPNQSVPRRGRRGVFQDLPRCQHRLHDRRGCLLGRSMRHARPVGKVGLGRAAILAPPLVEPTGRALQRTTNRAAGFALHMATNRFAAQGLFG